MTDSDADKGRILERLLGYPAGSYLGSIGPCPIFEVDDIPEEDEQ